MYSKLKSCVRMDNGLTDYFDCTIGTRQGCILSPLLFSLYMNKLVEMLKCYDCQGMYVNEMAKNIMILLYADDVAKGACTVKKLQDMINVLEEFCKNWGLSVNVDKTKIMVFRKGGSIRNNEKWYMFGKLIEIVTMYKYLGILFTSGLLWNKAIHTLSLQAKKAVTILLMYSIKCGGLPVSLAFELFDKMVLPILTYGAEVWGIRPYQAIEDVQIYFCKKVIGLPKNTSNNAVLGECGRHALYIASFKTCIKYWLKILKMPESRYTKCCYAMVKRMDERGKKTWATCVKEMLYKYGFGIVWIEQGVGDESLFISQFVQRLKDCHNQDWYREIHNSSKLSVYCTFKSCLEAEKYLECINVWKLRKALAKLRCSAHSLEIERGRHSGVLLEDRLCKYCEAQERVVIEDEYHFLLCCPRYKYLRDVYIEPQYTNNVSFETFITLMSSNNCDTLRKLALYIFHAFNIK